ncbi:ComEC/Rec2 family competence protein [Nonomuraea sp. NPDC050556]|uniref:ComEC/Rec2 family competence protein n=1 Tax=Nonomuraea sp. NPDC050556 TaxID=3364369 RepID=UPI00379A6282
MTSARLEIHVINVSQGDSLLIIHRNLAKVRQAIEAERKTPPTNPIDYVPFALRSDVPLAGTVVSALLVDGGDSSYGDDVVRMLTRQGVVTTPDFYPNLAMMVSHFHADHQAGLNSVLVDKDVPRKAKSKTLWTPRFIPARIYVNPLADKTTVPKNKMFPAFKKILEEISLKQPTGKRATIVEVQPGGLDPKTKKPLIINLGDGVTDKGGKAIPITIRMVASGQGVYRELFNDVEVVPPKGAKNAVDMNDRSLCFVLSYGSFRFFSGGDIAGDGRADGGNELTNAMPDPPKGKAAKYKGKKKNKKIGSSHSHGDVEKVLGPAMVQNFEATPLKSGADRFPHAGHCTVMKASHHASASSVDTFFLSEIRPYVVVISCGFRARAHDHPTQQVLDRIDKVKTPKWGLRGTTTKIDNTVEALYLTEVVKKRKTRTYTTNVWSGKLLGDIVIRPTDDSIVALRTTTDADERVRVQVYGTADETDTTDTENKLFPMTAGSGDANYPIGPFYHPPI